LRLGMVFFRYSPRFFEIARQRAVGNAGRAAGRDYSKSACGFCSKKVRTSSRKHRQIELEKAI